MGLHRRSDPAQVPPQEKQLSVTYPLWLLAAYVVGSLPTSYLAGRIAGTDLRQHGSQNLGATNTFRVLGWKYAVPVGLIDVLKGFIPVAFFAPLAGTTQWIPVAIGMTAVLGHVFPIWLKFRGGKGVATGAGVVLALAPGALGISVLTWGLVLLATGYVSLASIVAALSFPIAVRVLLPDRPFVFIVGLILAAFMLLTHRDNIRRLMSGSESRFGRRGNEVNG